ncbi:MAG: hypothetical protein OHK93_000448 [Ramalina farinacea]|uniref:Uncharacterized protein n=1 Tax=Ramalina farinacea TaxID=258253 RepID=A0AA43TND0_9LECA|nr:hypothetical protein [Ramalina farinacea]
MRLFLLPISTRQSLLYCHRLAQQTTSTAKPSLADRLTTKATTTWLEWEHKKSGWQKKVTDYGNKAFQRLPHEEWGLKSIPAPPSAQRRDAEEARLRSDPMKVEYPEGLIGRGRVMEALRRMGGDEKQAFHRKWLIGSVVGMPITAPVALVPM